MDGSKLKTPHLVRGVHVCKEKNYAFYDFLLMEDLEYAALLGLSTIRPFEVGRKGEEAKRKKESSEEGSRSLDSFRSGIWNPPRKSHHRAFLLFSVPCLFNFLYFLLAFRCFNYTLILVLERIIIGFSIAIWGVESAFLSKGDTTNRLTGTRRSPYPARARGTSL